MRNLGNDGAHLGMPAGQAIKVILGGEPEEKQEHKTPEDFATWIRSAPMDFKGLNGTADPYSEACRRLAKFFLILIVEGTKPTEECLWTAFKARWPEWKEEVGGFTGFMFGWAVNAARHVANLSPQSNPCIIDWERM